MRNLIWAVLALLCLSSAGAAPADEPALDTYEAFEGFIDIWWDEEKGRVLLRVDEFDAPFLYQTSLPRGIGSNDIGLDRGQRRGGARLSRGGSRTSRRRYRNPKHRLPPKKPSRRPLMVNSALTRSRRVTRCGRSRKKCTAAAGST